VFGVDGDRDGGNQREENRGSKDPPLHRNDGGGGGGGWGFGHADVFVGGAVVEKEVANGEW